MPVIEEGYYVWVDEWNYSGSRVQPTPRFYPEKFYNKFTKKEEVMEEKPYILHGVEITHMIFESESTRAFGYLKTYGATTIENSKGEVSLLVASFGDQELKQNYKEFFQDPFLKDYRLPEGVTWKGHTPLAHLIYESTSIDTRIQNFYGVRSRLRATNPQIDVDNHKLISYYASSEHQLSNRRTQIKIGRFIRKILPKLSDEEVQKLDDIIRKRFGPLSHVLVVGDKAEDFETAYAGKIASYENTFTNSYRKSLSNSCMRHNFPHLSAHPATVYASGDFKILYTIDPDDKTIGSRCVVHVKPDGTWHPAPIYGVSERTIDLIANHISKQDNVVDYNRADWSGAKLNKVEENGGYLGPYLDIEPRSLSVWDDHLQVDYDGEIDANDYSGILGNVACCSQCGDTIDSEEYHDPNGSPICECCYSEEVVYCDHSDSNEWVRDCTQVVMSRTRWGSNSEWVRDCDLNDFIEVDGTYYHVDMVVGTYDNEYITLEDANNSGDWYLCDYTGLYYPQDMVGLTTEGECFNLEYLEECGYVEDQHGEYEIPETIEEDEKEVVNG